MAGKSSWEIAEVHPQSQGGAMFVKLRLDREGTVCCPPTFIGSLPELERERSRCAVWQRGRDANIHSTSSINICASGRLPRSIRHWEEPGMALGSASARIEFQIRFRRLRCHHRQQGRDQGRYTGLDPWRPPPPQSPLRHSNGGSDTLLP